MSAYVRSGASVADGSAPLPGAPPVMVAGQMSIDVMLIQIMGTLARHDQKFDGLDSAIAKIDSDVVNLASSVKDLAHWKERVWGMVILSGWLVAAGAGVWAVVGKHLSWVA